MTEASAVTSASDFPPPPRKLIRRRGGATIWTMRAAGVTFLIAALALWGYIALDGAARLWGRSTPAMIRSIEGTSRNERIAHFVYNDGGAQIADSQRLNSDTQFFLHPGAVATVSVLKIGSWRVAVLQQNASDFWIDRSAALVGALVGSLVTLRMFVSGWIRPARIRFLVREGSMTVGSIVSKSVSTSRGGPFAAVYEYTVDGQTIRRRFSASQNEYRAAEPNQPLTILYQSGRPERHLIYERCSYSIVP